MEAAQVLSSNCTTQPLRRHGAGRDTGSEAGARRKSTTDTQLVRHEGATNLQQGKDRPSDGWCWEPWACAAPDAPVRTGRKLTRSPNTSSPGRRQGQSSTTLVWATTARARPQGHGRERRVNSDLVELKGTRGPREQNTRSPSQEKDYRARGHGNLWFEHGARPRTVWRRHMHGPQPHGSVRGHRSPGRSKQKPPGARIHDTQETRAGERAGVAGRQRTARGSISEPPHHPVIPLPSALPKQHLPPGPRGAANASASHSSTIRHG